MDASEHMGGDFDAQYVVAAPKEVEMVSERSGAEREAVIDRESVGAEPEGGGGMSKHDESNRIPKRALVEEIGLNSEGSTPEDNNNTSSFSPTINIPYKANPEASCPPEAVSPLASFQTCVQTLQYCAQLLGHIYTSGPRFHDLERDGTFPIVQTHNVTVPNTTQGQSLNLFGLQNPLQLLSMDEYRQRKVEGIWSQVIPRQMPRVDVLIETDWEKGHQFSSLYANCRNSEELNFLFKTDDDHPGDHSCRNQAHVLRHYMTTWQNCASSSTGLNIGFNYGVLASIVHCINSQHLTIGEIFEECYRMKFLPQPADPSPPSYLEHIWLIIEVSLMMNSLVRFSELVTPSNISTRFEMGRRSIESVLNHRSSLDDVLGLTIPLLFEILHWTDLPWCLTHHPFPQCPMDTNSNFPMHDLNAYSLNTVGGLTLKWTTILEDHLNMDLESKTLYIAWYGPPPSGSIMREWNDRVLEKMSHTTFLHGGPRLSTEGFSNQCNKEIVSTWAMLFGTSYANSWRARLNYNNLTKSALAGERSWMLEDCRKTQKETHLGNSLKGLEWQWYSTILYHIAKDNPISYSQFPIFEGRLRHLRLYMDSTKPRGLRELWYDKRDKGTYYTFWGVIVFGISTVVLALLSLVVSVIQAYASFKQLALSTTPTPSG